MARGYPYSALFTGKAFRVPVFQDTVSANTYRVLDSSGRLIFTRDSSNLWVRTVSNGWQKVGFNNGGGSLDSSVYYTVFRAYTSRNNIYTAISSIQSDSIFFASPIKVNGDTAYLNKVSVTDSGYLTPLQWNYIRLKVDSVKIYNDSLYYFVGDGDSTNVGAVGGGGTVTLQQAYDNAPTAPQINARNNFFTIDSIRSGTPVLKGYSEYGNGDYSYFGFRDGFPRLYSSSPSNGRSGDLIFESGDLLNYSAVNTTDSEFGQLLISPSGFSFTQYARADSAGVLFNTQGVNGSFPNATFLSGANKEFRVGINTNSPTTYRSCIIISKI